MTLGVVALIYSAYVVARSISQIGSQLLAGFLEQALQGLAAIVYQMVILEIATTALVWATQGAIPALIRAALRLSAWNVF